MNSLKTIICGLLVFSVNLAFAQGEKDIKPMRSQNLTDSERGFLAMGRAEEFLRKNQLDDAIAVFQEAIRLQGESRFFDHYFNYPLAKALALAGRNIGPDSFFPLRGGPGPGRRGTHKAGTDP